MRNKEFFMDYSNTKQYRKISTHGLVFDYRLPLQNLGNYFWGFKLKKYAMSQSKEDLTSQDLLYLT